MSVETARKELYNLGSPAKAERIIRFFKTAPGSYGEHDLFLGVTVPEVRLLAKQHLDVSFQDLSSFLSSAFNEERLLALLILRFHYEKASLEKQQTIVDFYIQHTEFINNWNLVDLSAPYILGDFVAKTNDTLLQELALSPIMWHRRIAIVASYTLIKQHRFDTTLHFAEIFCKDPEELMHKATGWMLREIGKREEPVLCLFLDQHLLAMPRTMLRYAIERFDEERRKKYLKSTKLFV